MWLSLLFLVIALAGLISNVSILVSVIKYKILRKKPYSILVSLAVCDLFKVVVLLSLAIYSADNGLLDMCTGTSIMGMTLIYVTTLHLAAESINRYLLIASPYKYQLTIKKKHVVILLAFLWLIPATMKLAIPATVLPTDWLDSMQFQSQMYGCMTGDMFNKTLHDEKNKEDWTIVFHVTFFALPLLVMIASYSMVLRVSYSTANDMRKNSIHVAIPSSHTVSESTYSNPIIDMVKSSFESVFVPQTLFMPEKIEHRPRASSMAAKAAKEIRKLLKDRRREIKASKTVFIMICVFVVCNAPIFSIAWLDFGKNSINRDIKQALVGVAFLQVFIDPIVYFARLKDYKSARKKCRQYGQTMVRKASRKIR